MSNSPGNFDQFNQGYDARPRQSSGCFKGCVIVGLLLLLLLLLLAGGVYWLYHKITGGMTDDPAEVARRLHEQYPTAQLPPGYAGTAGFRLRLGFDLDFLVFAKENADINKEGGIDSGDAMILFHIKVPGDERANFDFNQLAGQARLIEKRPYPLRVGDYEFKASMQKVAPADGPANDVKTQIEVWLGPNTVLLMQGDGDQVDEAGLKAFLASIAKDCPSATKVEKAPAKPEGQPAATAPVGTVPASTTPTKPPPAPPPG